ncbi:hypothetical protein [Parasediminibacterium sp. JCM 36343]|uniref:hypothetical protein n=1 Tax=Parasediminibacterium sp. JCM 36343 TaxID=3374279 RepID=UPI003979F8F6
MLTTIKGVYHNGQIILEEAPDTSMPVEVLVTFTKDVEVQPKEKKPLVFGFAKGSVLYMAPDFNAPLDELKDY